MSSVLVVKPSRKALGSPKKHPGCDDHSELGDALLDGREEVDSSAIANEAEHAGCGRRDPRQDLGAAIDEPIEKGTLGRLEGSGAFEQSVPRVDGTLAPRPRRSRRKPIHVALDPRGSGHQLLWQEDPTRSGPGKPPALGGARTGDHVRRETARSRSRASELQVGLVDEELHVLRLEPLRELQELSVVDQVAARIVGIGDRNHPRVGTERSEDRVRIDSVAVLESALETIHVRAQRFGDSPQRLVARRLGEQALASFEGCCVDGEERAARAQSRHDFLPSNAVASGQGVDETPARGEILRHDGLSEKSAFCRRDVARREVVPHLAIPTPGEVQVVDRRQHGGSLSPFPGGRVRFRMATRQGENGARAPTPSPPPPPPDEEGSESEPAPPPSPPPVSVGGIEPRKSGGFVWRMSGVVKTVRPHQWVKNAFVLAPVVFAKEIFDPLLLWRAGAAFLCFCLLAGAVYTMNDLADVEADRQHPVKRFRPIASGRVPVPVARALAISLVTGALAGAAFRSVPFFVVAASYFGLNIAYSFRLKQIAYLDVGCIAGGFVLRVLGGGYATQLEVSHYLLACTLLLALFLGFGKQRHELALAAAGGKTRQALESYSPRGLDIALWSTALATVGTYLAYTLDARTQEFFKTEWLWPSTLFVVLGMWRFLYLMRSRPRSESPTQEMLKDGPMVGIVLIWVVLVMWLVYHLQPGAR